MSGDPLIAIIEQLARESRVFDSRFDWVRLPTLDVAGLIINGHLFIMVDSETVLRLGPSDVDRVLTNAANESQPRDAGNAETLASTPSPASGVESKRLRARRCSSPQSARARLP